MDLPSCPACGQSVLDDDAADCPFCGASMSGKPGAAAAPASPSAVASPGKAHVTQTATPGATQSSPKKSRPQTTERTTPAGADDPFEFERKNEDNTIRLRLKPGPGRRHDVTCPMCETVGYTARKAAGLNVHCANPNCQLPVFKAPPLTQEQLDEDAAAGKPDSPNRKLWTPVNIATIVALVAVSGWAFWFFAWRKPTRLPVNSVTGPDIVDPVIQKSTDIKTGKSTDGRKKKVADPPDRQAAFRKFRAEVLAKMLRNVEQVEVGIVKPTAWQLTIDAHLQTGDLKTAAGKLKQLRVVSQGAEFLEIRPLVALARGQWQQGTEADRQTARDLLTKAVGKVATLPRRGRQRYELAAELSAALISQNRRADADQIIVQFANTGEEAQLSLLLQWCRIREKGDMDLVSMRKPFHRPANPLHVSVLVHLAAQREWKAGWDWALSLSDSAARQECVTVWGELRERLGASATADDGLPDRNAVLKQLTPPFQAIFLARVAIALQDSRRPKEAAAALAQARDTLQNTVIPPFPAIPDFKAAIEATPLPAAEVMSRTLTAHAFAEIARTELIRNPDKFDAAWESIEKGVRMLRTLSPPLPAVSRLAERVRSPNDRETRKELAAALELNDAAVIDTKFRAYRAAVNALESASRHRFQLVLELFEQFAELKNAGISTVIWTAMTGSDSSKHEMEKDDWSKTRLPFQLAVATLAGGDERFAERIRKHIRDKAWSPSAIESRWLSLWANAAWRLTPEESANAARSFDDPAFRKIDSTEKELMAIRIASKAVKSGDLKTAHDFTRSIRDPILRLEIFNLIGQQAAAAGQTQALWAFLQNHPFRPEETVALCHGIIVGMEPAAFSRVENKTTASLPVR